MVRFSKFGTGSLIAGLVIVGAMLQFLYLPATTSGSYVDALVLFVIDLLKGAIDWAGVGLIIAGVLLFVL